ncbi:hypothetical protein EDB86DRAFT_3087895 [Lactarius hatsudake]|nr:hypothetical protein EDB86DRAFT_3087895 [Lactarius hatsudake]
MTPKFWAMHHDPNIALFSVLTAQINLTVESSSPGDVLALCIRHGASSPSATTPHIPAALRRIPGGHRSETAEHALLPESDRAIVALSHASAYSTAEKAIIPQALLDLYECSATSPAVALPCALPRVAPDIEKHFVDLNIKHAVRSDSNWLAQVQYIPEFTGNAQSGIPGVAPSNDGRCAPVPSVYCIPCPSISQ